MTIIINLIGQPGCGKSTTMADLFSTMKYMDLNVEMCPEWVKKLAWKGEKINKYSQVYIMGKEISQQSRILNKVEYAISDSPVFLSDFYNRYYYNEDTLYQVVRRFYEMAEEDGAKFINIFLKRNKKYNPEGRYQTEEQSDAVATALQEYLDTIGLDYYFLDCKDSARVKEILSIIRVDK